MPYQLDVAVPFHVKYEHRVKLEIDWPYEVRYEGHDYRRTGKEGTNRESGKPLMEYQFTGRPEPERLPVEARLWLRCDGTIFPE